MIKKLKHFDLYGSGMSLRIHTQSRHKSIIGGIFSIFSILGMLFIVFIGFYQYLGQQVQIRSTSLLYSEDDDTYETTAQKDPLAGYIVVSSSQIYIDLFSKYYRIVLTKITDDFASSEKTIYNCTLLQYKNFIMCNFEFSLGSFHEHDLSYVYFGMESCWDLNQNSPMITNKEELKYCNPNMTELDSLNTSLPYIMSFILPFYTLTKNGTIQKKSNQYFIDSLIETKKLELFNMPRGILKVKWDDGVLFSSSNKKIYYNWGPVYREIAKDISAKLFTNKQYNSRIYLFSKEYDNTILYEVTRYKLIEFLCKLGGFLKFFSYFKRLSGFWNPYSIEKCLLTKIDQQLSREKEISQNNKTINPNLDPLSPSSCLISTIKENNPKLTSKWKQLGYFQWMCAKKCSCLKNSIMLKQEMTKLLDVFSVENYIQLISDNLRIHSIPTEDHKEGSSCDYSQIMIFKNTIQNDDAAVEGGGILKR